MPEPVEVDLSACVGGDGDAWNAFVDRYSGVIYAAVSRTLRGGAAPGGRHGLEDPVQDVFLRLIRDDYRLLRAYDPKRAALTTWLTLIARSVAIDHLRKRRPDAASIGPADTVPAPAPAAATTTPDPPLHVLSARQTLVLRMLFDEGMSVPEAAALLGVDNQTIRSTKHKALTRLREHFEPG